MSELVAFIEVGAIRAIAGSTPWRVPAGTRLQARAAGPSSVRSVGPSRALGGVRLQARADAPGNPNWWPPGHPNRT